MDKEAEIKNVMIIEKEEPKTEGKIRKKRKNECKNLIMNCS